MNIFKKLGALTSASALVGAGIVAAASSAAFAAPVTAEFEADYYAMGDTAILNVTGCVAGADLEIAHNAADETIDLVVAEDGIIPAVEIELADDLAGELMVEVTCFVAGEEIDTFTAQASAIVLDQILEADPASFLAGETVTITAGEFVPGTTATLAVSTIVEGAVGAEVWTTTLGTVGDDMLVVGDVVFPDTLECGVYDVTVGTGDNEVSAELNICAEDDVDETPAPVVTPTPTVTAVPVPTTPVRPGLPSTGV